MDIPVAGAEPVAPPSNDNTRGELIAVGVAAVVILAAVTVAVRFVLILARSNEFSFFAPFTEWQLYAVEGAIGVVVLLVGGLALVRLVRQYRGLRDRTPHRRVMLLVALLPGLALGGAAVAPMRATLSWASHQTAAWAAAQHPVVTWTVDNRSAPRETPPVIPMATGPTAAALLPVADYGEAWSVTFSRAETTRFVSKELAPWGVTAAALTMLTQRHSTEETGSPEVSVAESAYAFTGQDEARRYLTREWPRPDETCGCRKSPNGSRTTTRLRPSAKRVRGATVREYETNGVYGIRRAAAFAVGSVVVILTMDVASDDPSGGAFDALVARAVAHATAALP